jgi:NTE family protein
MGADVIIAVNVGTPLLTREQLGSILGVTGQMLSILTEQNVQASLAKLKPADILITPELGKYSTGDFDHLPDIVPRGEAAARKVAERLAQLAIPAEEYAALRQKQLVTVAPDLRPVDEIRFEKLARVNPKNAQAVMETKPGQPIDQATLDADMRRIYGTGDFEHVNYSYIEEQGRRIMAVDAVEKTWGPDYLRFGLGLSSDFGNDAYYNILASYRKTWINRLGAEWRTDLQVGRTSSLYSEFYQPFNVGKLAFFVAPRIGIEGRPFDLYQGNTRVATYDVGSAWAGADLGVNFRQYGTLRFGVNAGKTEATATPPGSSSAPTTNTTSGTSTPSAPIPSASTPSTSASRPAARPVRTRCPATTSTSGAASPSSRATPPASSTAKACASAAPSTTTASCAAPCSTAPMPASPTKSARSRGRWCPATRTAC